MQIVKLDQGTEEWLNFRKHKIGGSDAPIVMGESPWRTPYELWEDKVGLVKNTKSSFAMSRGIELEPVARSEFERLTGKSYLPVVIQHPENDFMIASLDGLSEDETSIVEIKCPKAVDHELAKRGHIPKHYYAQIQHQLACCSLDMAYYFSFDGEQGCVVEVYKDASYIAEMIECEYAFIQCVRQFCPPSLSDRDYTEIDDPEWQTLSQRYTSIKRLLSDYEKEEKEIKDRLLVLAGRSNTKGNGLKLSKVIRKGSVDYDAVLKHYEIDTDLDQFRKPAVESWRITT